MQELSSSWHPQRIKDDKSNANIIVAVRIRPETEEELNSWRTVVKVLDEHVLVFDPADLNRHMQRGLPNHSQRRRDIKFAFDYVFDQYATQQEVYERTTKHLINEVLSGFNCTCFAYGATGAGKTFTMIGTSQAPGIMVLTMKDLFEAIKKNENEKQYKLSISYLEVYNEQIRDLLVETSKPLVLREDPEKGCHVAGLSEHSPTSADEVMKLLEIGNSRRTQHPTDANSQSSRSHAVLQITVRQVDRTADVTVDVRTGKLSLIDLAGSERAARTKNRGVRLVEGANINRSLLALGNCINALGEGYREGKYVPYRDSKLTRLLKDSLGGNCKTVMIANISPSSLNYEDTFNTLQYANRAKNIKTKVTRNVINVKFHIGQYKEIIASLRNEVAELKEKLRQAESRVQTQTNCENDPEVEKIRIEIKDLVNERLNLTKSLLEIQHQEDTITQNLEDKLRELEKCERECLLIYGQERQRTTPSHIRNLKRQLEDLKMNEQQNTIAKTALLKKIQRIVEDTQQLQQELARQNQQHHGVILLNQDLVIHWLELEKLHRDLELRKRDAVIRHLSHALRQQLSLLQEKGLTNEKNSREVFQLLLSAQNLCRPPKANELPSENIQRNDTCNVLLPLTPTPKEQTSILDNAKNSNSKSYGCFRGHHYSPVFLSSNQNLLLGISPPQITKRHSFSPNEFSQYQVPFTVTTNNDVVFSVPPLVVPYYSFNLPQTDDHSSTDCVHKENNVSINCNKSNITNSSRQLKSILMKPNNNKMSGECAVTPITKRKKHVTFANVSPSPTKLNADSSISTPISKENDSNLNSSNDTKNCVVGSFPLNTDSKSSQNATVTPCRRRLQPFNPLDSEIFKPLTTAMREQLKSPALAKTKKWGFYQGRWGFFRK